MLEKFRKKIDAIDRKIIFLLEERIKISINIGKFKKQNSLSIRDVNREKEIFSQITRKTSLDPNFIKQFYNLIFRFSRKIQK
ncbi:chorismate mutase [Candidatus Pacearchaeota archaeon CG10_big_fil_rev_8_21_14_0_10_32_42]|nr:MAG: chorismate mutase [Candidatus Pacearchaeota archaeon CG10_big_fil_rev_8_21_14_0_10_32_42]